MSLDVTELIGFGVGEDAASPAVVTYVGFVDDGTGTTSTMTSASIGAAAADRLVVVAYSWEDTTGRTLNSVTIGGVAATIIAQGHVTANGVGVAFAQLLVPAGTTATIVSTFSGSVGRLRASIFNVTGYSSPTPVTAFNSSTTAATAIAVSGAVLNGGVAIVALALNDNNAVSWTNATVRNDAQVNSGASRASAADFTETGPDETRTYTAIYASQSGAAIGVAAWR